MSLITCHVITSFDIPKCIRIIMHSITASIYKWRFLIYYETCNDFNIFSTYFLLRTVLCIRIIYLCFSVVYFKFTGDWGHIVFFCNKGWWSAFKILYLYASRNLQNREEITYTESIMEKWTKPLKTLKTTARKITYKLLMCATQLRNKIHCKK